MPKPQDYGKINKNDYKPYVAAAKPNDACTVGASNIDHRRVFRLRLNPIFRSVDVRMRVPRNRGYIYWCTCINHSLPCHLLP